MREKKEKENEAGQGKICDGSRFRLATEAALVPACTMANRSEFAVLLCEMTMGVCTRRNGGRWAMGK